MSHWGKYASRLKTVDEAPEPFRRALSAHLSPADSIRLLIFCPADETFDKRPPSTLLAVTTSGWIVVADAEGGTTAVRCDFADTLLVELTNILLYGRLKIDFVAEGRTQSVAIEFSTVTDRLFQEAVQLLLDGMDGISAAIPIEDSQADSLLRSLPLKFWNALIEFRPVSQPVLAVLH